MACDQSLNPVERYSKRTIKILRLQSEKLNWDGNTFPTELNKIGIFEKIIVLL